MPTRRNTLIGLGILTAGGAGAVATGAFSAATAQRNVSAELTGDANAILGFDSTSAYAAIDDTADGQNVLSISFDDLNANANFTFEDTFRVINRGTSDVRLVGVGSSNSDADWTTAPFQVLVANEASKWQGDPNSGYVDITVESDDINKGSFSAGELDSEGGSTQAPLMTAPATQGSDGGWLSIGFKFGTDGSVGDWNPNNHPENLQLEFESVSDSGTS
jgi:hypothetical protein